MRISDWSSDVCSSDLSSGFRCACSAPACSAAAAAGNSGAAQRALLRLRLPPKPLRPRLVDKVVNSGILQLIWPTAASVAASPFLGGGCTIATAAAPKPVTHPHDMRPAAIHSEDRRPEPKRAVWGKRGSVGGSLGGRC